MLQQHNIKYLQEQGPDLLCNLRPHDLDIADRRSHKLQGRCRAEHMGAA